MLSEGHETFEHQLLELVKRFRPIPTQHLNVFLSQFKGSRFEIKVAWRVAEHESEVYVDHVALGVQQNVAVVSVLDLENVAQETIPRH